MHGEVVVAPQGAIRYHHSFGESRGAAGVVDECQFVGALLVIVFHMLATEILWKLASVELVEVLTGVG